MRVRHDKLLLQVPGSLPWRHPSRPEGLGATWFTMMAEEHNNFSDCRVEAPTANRDIGNRGIPGAELSTIRSCRLYGDVTGLETQR